MNASVQPTASPRWLPWLLILTTFLLLFGRSMTRFLDLDEHQFVAPPLLLLQQGQTPYADYPYFHMPTLVYLYAGLMAWLPYPLLVARVVSVLCGTTMLALLARVGWDLFADRPLRERWPLALSVPALIAGCRLFTYTNGWSWNHDPATLSALLAFCCHVRGLRRGSVGWFALAGGFVGLAVGIRLSFALIFVPFALSLLLSRSSLTVRARAVGLGLAVLGATLTLTPAWVLFVRHPDQFLFGNLGYPRLSTEFYRACQATAMTLPGKVYHCLQTFLTDPGNAALAVFAAFSVYRQIAARTARHGTETWLLLGLMPALVIGSMGPTPMQYQYYFMLLPFLGLVILYRLAGEPRDGRAYQSGARWLVGAAVVVTAIGLPRWYWGAIYLPVPSRWVPMQVQEVGEWVRDHTPGRDRILTIDPLVPLQAGRRVAPDYAVGRFILLVDRFADAATHEKYHLLGRAELPRYLADRPPSAVFLDSRVAGDAEPLLDYARREGFREIVHPGGKFSLWVRDGRP